jgi:Methyltransferase domain
MRMDIVEHQAHEIDVYVRSRMFSVAGYLNSLDARIIACLLSSQKDNIIRGNLCEIGVHHGRLFFILALARQADECALAVDLFEDDKINFPSGWHRGRDRALLVNANRLGIPIRASEMLKTSSLAINTADLIRCAGGPIRFFSVDGGHDYQHVVNDLQLAESTLSDGGIIAVDDFFNLNWPEVTFGTYDFVRRSDKVVPFSVSPEKLYLTTASMVSKYQAALREANLGADSGIVRFFGHDLTLTRYGRYGRALNIARSGIGRYARHLASRAATLSRDPRSIVKRSS